MTLRDLALPSANSPVGLGTVCSGSGRDEQQLLLLVLSKDMAIPPLYPGRDLKPPRAHTGETVAGANGFVRQKPGQVDCNQSQKAPRLKVNTYLGAEAQGQRPPSVAAPVVGISLRVRGGNIKGQTSNEVWYGAVGKLQGR